MVLDLVPVGVGSENVVADLTASSLTTEWTYEIIEKG